MMSFTTADKPKSSIRIWAVAAWLFVWEAASIIIGQEILLVSPVSVALRLTELVREADFWKSVLFSFMRIVLGFLFATTTGVVAAALSARFNPIKHLMFPFMTTIKATPVASIIILALIWVPSRNLSVLISFLMVLPIIFTNVLNGIQNTDAKLLEMAKIFNVSAGGKILYVYTSQVLPFFLAACSIGLGLCWKSGIAAEVIGIPTGSIGEKLYKAKIYLATADLFAWTVTIIIISVMFEKLFLLMLKQLVRKLERM